MASAEGKVKRLLIIKVRVLGDANQARVLVTSTAPFYHALGVAGVRFLQNVDEPAQFLIEVEYETDATLELNRQKVASDPMLRNLIQGWRQLLAGNAEIDVY